MSTNDVGKIRYLSAAVPRHYLLMAGNHRMRNQYRYTTGFLLPAAIFLLVILAALGAYALNVTSLQNAGSTQDVQGARAYQMARAGVEWAGYQVLSPGSVALANCPANPSVISVDGFTVTISCTRFADAFEQGSDRTIAMYSITSTAVFGAVGTSGYVERQIQVILSKCLATDAPVPYQCG